jgi:hypothetical protein
MAEKNYFEVLNGINVNDKVEKKNGLSYLSWAYAWGELKKKYPEATYTIYENADGWNYFTDGLTCWVKTGVTVQGIEHIEYLPIMDYRNKSIPKDLITSFDVNKAIQRSLTKAVARHGLGLYIYAGEDLPEETPQTSSPAPVKKAKPASTMTVKEARAKFVNACKEYKIDPAKAANDFGLDNESSINDFENAIMVIADRVRRANKEA